MEQRLQSAMQLIGQLSRDPALRSPARSGSAAATLGAPLGGGPCSPMRASGVDDVRIVVKDKSRRTAMAHSAVFKSSPRGSAGRLSPVPDRCGACGAMACTLLMAVS